MSFLTERFFNILENHKIYERIISRQSLVYFLERHVICVWSYHAIMRTIQRDLAAVMLPLNSDSNKEAVRLISEIILDEEVDDLGDGRLLSHMELYLQGMQSLDCDMSHVFSFFDLLERGNSPERAARKSRFQSEVLEYVKYIDGILKRPLHVRATALFYEGEPYIPDQFLHHLFMLGEKVDTIDILNYFKRHIEGLKSPGFSAAGRLVEILCESDYGRNNEAERAAESLMRNRIKFWDALYNGLEEQCHETLIETSVVRHLRLVT